MNYGSKLFFFLHGYDSVATFVRWLGSSGSDSRFIATVTNIGFFEERVWYFVVVNFV
jgi:hypothetical protein